MSRARLVLHAAALVLPPLFALGAELVLLRSGDLAGIWPFVVAAMLAAQLAAFAGWFVIERYLDRRRLAPIGAGLLMGVLTHLLFGPMIEVVAQAGGLGPVETNLGGLLGFSLYSLLFVGWASVPAVMLASLYVAHLRRKELSRVTA